MSQIKNTETRYGLVAIWFHWMMAVLVLGMIALGWYMKRFAPEELKGTLYGLHKEFGVIVLALIIIRFAWRYINIMPLLTGPRWENIAARVVHLSFYVFLILLPLTGWLMSSAGGYPVSFFGLFTLPNIIEKNEYWGDVFDQIHTYLAYSLLAVIGLHVLATIKHHFIDKDDTLRRIL